MGKITVEVKINTFGTMKHPSVYTYILDKRTHGKHYEMHQRNMMLLYLK